MDHLNALFGQLAQRDRRVTLIDLPRLICPCDVIPNVVDGVNVRNDGTHFTLEGAEYVSRRLLPQLRTLGTRKAATLSRVSAP